MKIVIQCASSKLTSAETLRTRDGHLVSFVGDPANAPRHDGEVFARPDDPSDRTDMTWRQQVEECNRRAQSTPRLTEAYRLYQPKEYQQLVATFGAENVFILSAGWGLVSATYQLPTYDITFSCKAEAWKRRRVRDTYDDFCQIQSNMAGGPLVFLGCSDYLPLFERLTESVACEKVVFYRSATPPHNPQWSVRRFVTTQKTNWHYACAKDLICGKLRI